MKKTDITQYETLKGHYYPIYEETYKDIKFTIGVDCVCAYSATIEFSSFEDMLKLLEIDVNQEDGTLVESDSSILASVSSIFKISQGMLFRNDNCGFIYAKAIGCILDKTRNVPTRELIDLCEKHLENSKGSIMSAKAIINDMEQYPEKFRVGNENKGYFDGLVYYHVTTSDGVTRTIFEIDLDIAKNMCRKFIDKISTNQTHKSFIDRISKDLKRYGGKDHGNKIQHK